MFSEQGKRYWKFAECVAQCGTNSLKISESDYAVRPSIHFYKIAPGAPANAATLFARPKGDQAQQARQGGSRRTRNPPASEIRRSWKIKLAENMYRARKTSPRFSTVRLSPVGKKKGGRLGGLAQAGAERLERLDEVSRVVLEVELAEPGRPP